MFFFVGQLSFILPKLNLHDILVWSKALGEWWQYWTKLTKQCSDLLLEETMMLTCQDLMVRKVSGWILCNTYIDISIGSNGSCGFDGQNLGTYLGSLPEVSILDFPIHCIIYIYYLNLCRRIKTWPTKELCHRWHTRDPLCGGGRPRISAMNRWWMDR